MAAANTNTRAAWRAKSVEIADIVALPDEALLSEPQAAAWLGKSPRTLANRRALGTPLLPFLKVGDSVRHRVGTVRRTAAAEAMN